MTAISKIEQVLMDEFGGYDDITIGRFHDIVDPLEQQITELKELLNMAYHNNLDAKTIKRIKQALK